MAHSTSKSPDKDFDEIEEPSILSADPNERKLARRLRIQKRAIALEKLHSDKKDEDVVDESITEKQILTSTAILEKIIAEGNEVITNVRVANDAREVERRKIVGEVADDLLRRLDENALECKRRYDIINERWSTILESNDPLDINCELQAQKEKCDELLAEKDVLIADLREELRKADERYFGDQKKQKDDIKLLIERVENQMSAMENIYSRELFLIEKAFKTERDNLVFSFQSKWEALYKQQGEEDAAGEEKRNKIMDEYEAEMERVMTEHDEEFRKQKIELEKECQAMQLQLEKTKALCVLNAEKLSYNYTVLKNREEENSIVKSQQKRKINKLQGILNNLKKQYADLQENTKLEIEKLTGLIFRHHRNISELEEKSIHFTRINEKQYLDIWNMNTENANQLVKRIFAADKIIHERTLGILWERPEKSFPKKEDLPSYRAAMEIIQKRKQDEVERLKIFEYDKTEKSASEIKLEREVLNNILKQISNCSGYLIEEKLQELISNRTEEEKTIIRLDNVFQALSIKTPEEINMLLDFFLPYAYCPICTNKEDTISSELTKTPSASTTCADVCPGCTDENVRKLVDTVKEEVEKNMCKSDTSDNFSSSDAAESSEGSINIEQECNADVDLKRQTKRFTCDKGHVLEIQSAHVTKAMKEIVTKCNAAETKEMLSFEERLREKKFTISRNLSVEDVRYYWSCYKELFGPQKQKLWDAILIGLSKYYEILKERYKLCTETETLRKQNAELQRLLISHGTSSEDGSYSALQVRSSKYSV